MREISKNLSFLSKAITLAGPTVMPIDMNAFTDQGQGRKPLPNWISTFKEMPADIGEVTLTEIAGFLNKPKAHVFNVIHLLIKPDNYKKPKGRQRREAHYLVANLHKLAEIYSSGKKWRVVQGSSSLESQNAPSNIPISFDAIRLELSRIDRASSYKFFANTQPHFIALDRLVNDERSEQIIRQILITLHVLKGFARVYSFSILAKSLDHSEKMIRAFSTNKKVHSLNLDSSIEDIQAIYKLYKQFYNGLSNREKHESDQLEKGRKFTDLVKDCLPAITKIAIEENKGVPRLDILGKDILIRPEEDNVVLNSLLKIFANSIVHGIELTSSRISSGKYPVGAIRVFAKEENDVIHISVSDDGRGLDLTSLCDKGLGLQMITQSADLEELASLVLKPNVTSLDKPSVNVRMGFGLSAVKLLVESIGGSIQVKLEKSSTSTQRYFQFETVIQIPRQVENLNNGYEPVRAWAK